MAALPAAALFATGAMGLPLAAALAYDVSLRDSEWRGVFPFIVLLFWTVPGVFGAGLYQFALARRCRRLGAEPRVWAGLLLGVAFSSLPLALIPIARATQGRINPVEGLVWLMPVAGSALGLAFAGLTPLRFRP